MMDYFSKTVHKAYKASKKVITGRSSQAQSQALSLIKSLYKRKQQVLPISKMNKLAVMSFNIDQFQQIKNILIDKLSEYNFSKSSKIIHNRNLLIITGYLIKHGAGGFIDEFRQNISIFKQYEAYEYKSYLEEDEDRKKRYIYLTEEVKNRATHVITLLQDKNKLLREKELAMMVKKKMQMYSQQNHNSMNKEESEEEKKGTKEKVESFVQNYIWRYIDKFDEKIDQVAEVLANKIQKYLLEQVPENFQIDDMEVNGPKLRTQLDFAVDSIKKEEQFVKQKHMEVKSGVVTKDLLQL